MQISPVLRKKSRASDGAGREAGNHDGDHAGYPEQLFPGKIHDVGKSQRKRHFGGLRAVKQGRSEPKQTSAEKTDNDSATETCRNMQGACNEAWLPSVGKDAQQHREQHDRGGIIEQAFSFNQPHQARGDAEITEDADHRRRVGRRHDRADQKRNDGCDAAQDGEWKGNAGRRDEHGDDREC